MGKEESYTLLIDKQNLYTAVEIAVKAARNIINGGRIAYSALYAKKFNKTPEQGLAAIDTITKLVGDIPDKFRQTLINLDSKEKEVEAERREKATAQEKAAKSEGEVKTLEQKLKTCEKSSSDLEKDLKDTKGNYEALKTEHGELDIKYTEEKKTREYTEKDLKHTQTNLDIITGEVNKHKADSTIYNNAITTVLEKYFGVPKSEIKTLAGNPEALTQKLEEKTKENKEMQDSILEGFDESLENTDIEEYTGKETDNSAPKKTAKKGKTVSVKGLKN